MKTKIGIFGSCCSQDIFRSVHNENYKDKIDLCFKQVRVSFISLMEKPVQYDKNSIKILPDNTNNRYSTRLIRFDLSKSLFDELKKHDIDYLIFDLNFEVKFGIFKHGNVYYTNNYWDYPKTKFFKQLGKVQRYSMMRNHDMYLKLWTARFKKFYNYMKKNFPKVKLVLHKVVLTDKVYRSDGTMFINSEKSHLVKTQNPLIKELEDYVIDNFDVEIIDATMLNWGDEDHIFGVSPGHYKKGYYNYAYDQFLQIVERNKLEQLSAENKNLKKELDDKKETIKELNDNIRQKKVLIKELFEFKEGVLNSTSWKITKPLRKIKKD